MTPIAIALILASALVHVAWNLAGKRQMPTPAFFYAASLFGALILTPAIVIHARELPRILSEVAWILVATGLFQMIYYVSIARAYHYGELSVAYPLARALPPLLVLLASLALGRGHSISTSCMIGCLAVVAGALLLAGGPRRSQTWPRKSTIFACLAAAGTAGYTLVDDHALSVLRRSNPLSVANLTLVYGALEAIVTSLWFTAFVLFTRSERKELVSTFRDRWRAGLRVGIGVQTAYLLLLASLAFVDDVSYAAAFRQISLPLGALAGVLLLGESRSTRKLVAVALCSIGAVLVGVG